jgi:hypothetical protein
MAIKTGLKKNGMKIWIGPFVNRTCWNSEDSLTSPIIYWMRRSEILKGYTDTGKQFEVNFHIS